MKSVVKAAVLALVGLMLFSTADANAQLKFGVRQHNFHNSFLPSEQTLGAYFGFGVGRKADVIFGADYYSYKFSTQVDLSQFGGVGSEESSLTASSAWLHGGLKFYFAEQDKGSVCPYVIGEFFKAFGSISTEPDLGDNVDLSPAEDLLSPYGFIAGFGAEFFAAENFSVGGETGVRYVITKSSGASDLLSLIDLSGLGLAKSSAAQADDETKLTTMTIYTGITINFTL